MSTRFTGPRNWGTVAVAASIAGVTPQTMRRWAAEGLVYGERIGPRLIRVDLDSLEAAGTPLQFAADAP